MGFAPARRTGRGLPKSRWRATASARATARRCTSPSDSSCRRRPSRGVMPSRAATFSTRLFTSARPTPLTCNPNSIFSRAVARNRIGRCSTSVTRRRAARLAVTTAPSSRTRPWVGRSSRASSRSSVLLPEPFGPTTAMAVPGGTAKRSSWSTTRPSYSCRTPTSSSMSATLERLQGDVHEQGEEQEDEAERERQAEVALARVQGHRGGEGTGLAPDVPTHGHGGADLGDHVAERRRDHRREREASLARHGPRGAPAAGTERLGGAAGGGVPPPPGGGGGRGGDR